MSVMKSKQANGQRSATEPTQEPVKVEWAQINDHQVVVATKDRMWVRELDLASGQDPFAEPMSGPGSKATTRQLLDAAWCAGMGAAQSNRATAHRSLARYVRELIGAYILTSTTPGLLREMAGRFHRTGRPDLEIFARRFARLEDGDQQMAADDLHALGYSAQKLVRNCPPPPATMALRDYFTARAQGPHPIEGLGYAYAIERTSLSFTKADLRALGSVLPAGVDAMKCRWHHSGVGGDVAHVKYFIHACARLPGPDRAHIARATYEAMTFISGLPTDDEIEDAALEREHSHYRLAGPPISLATGDRS